MSKTDEFQILEGLTAIRTRPGTYIGDMSNVSNMVREVIDNGIDEFHKGVNDTVYIKIEDIKTSPKKNIRCIVADRSKTGFPLDEAEIGGKPIGQTKMDASVSHLHAGSKFDKSIAMNGMNGCFTGDTLIYDADNKHVVRLDSLVGKQNIKVLSVNKNGRAQIVTADAVVLTKHVDVICKVKIGQTIIKCTTDHRFMLSNGMYKKAEELCTGDCLRSFGDDFYVSSVTKEQLNTQIPVYDVMNAGDNSNFMLAIDGGPKGIFVHNCGNKAVNALSDDFLMITKVIKKTTKFPKKLKYDGEKWYYLHYKKGVKKEEGFAKNLKELGFEDLKDYTTIVSFIPDLSIFETANYSLPKGLDYTLKLAELTGRKLNIILNDQPYVSKVEDLKYKFDVTMPGLYKDGKNPKVRIFGSFQFNGDILTKNNVGCVNSLAVHQGLHIDMFRKAYKLATRELLGDAGGMEDNGVDATVFILANEVDFDSQSKTKLSRIPDFDKNDLTVLKNELKSIMKSDLSEFEDNFAKIQNLRAKRGELNKKQTLANLLGDMDDNSTKNTRRADSYKPKRLKDAWTSDRSKAELLVFEGNSALSSSHKTRNPEFQALFPMRGVCKNTIGKDILDVLKNDEMNDLFRSIGAGVEGFSNLSKIRFNKIIYFGDSDEDARRIVALFVGAFGQHAKFLIDAGKLFIGQTPFYFQNGKAIYAEDGDVDKQLDKSKPFERIKGLGGLGKHFHDAVTNVKTRRIVQVTNEDLEEALEVLRSGPKKKEILLSTKIVSTDVWVEKKGK
ncbi:MAG: hypothetical protein MJZ34_02305 [Paludibacteraceae bacterium]|nr:hypothetical protein [Paludibacteraceae bacterium]